jgi:acetyl esterase
MKLYLCLVSHLIAFSTIACGQSTGVRQPIGVDAMAATDASSNGRDTAPVQSMVEAGAPADGASTGPDVAASSDAVAGLDTSLSVDARADGARSDTASAAPEAGGPPLAVTTREVVYKKTAQGDLKTFIDAPVGVKPGDRRPAIIFFFGGGWTSGDAGQFASQGTHFASRGMIAVRPNYRVKSRQGTTPLEAVEDAKSAVRWVRQQAAQLGIDPDRIVASGGSAGGHIAACAALITGMDASGEDLAVSSRPNLLVLYNPVLDMAGEVSRFPGPDPAAQARSVSPLLFVDARTPATQQFFGTLDGLLSQGRGYDTKARAAGVTSEVLTALNQKHAFARQSPWLEATTAAADDFLRRQGYLAGPSGVKIPPGGSLDPL